MNETKTTKATNRKDGTMTTTKPRPTVYFKGDKGEYTGTSKTLYGAVCHEVTLVEGHLAGTTIWTYQAPGMDRDDMWQAIRNGQ